ncbi:helix-turn-helix transcriptional regulator [Bradyrhizobium brasilense]|uniref:helix-turn-helix transcriptional regulator n=1 Tax=Bradyrhizobium brasilense TaxID=1419277 RepID=UPI0024B18AAB|nr:helix-turn-helix transcriptional regulator [Bradyrhizobium australafricanum]WFU32377.1 helix-turn-helix transcriptional regulator [Bradyrhizobium australafricanum]
MNDCVRFVAAVEAIYNAAPHPSNWPLALQAIADVFRAAGTVLMWRRDDGSFGTIVSPGLVTAQEVYHQAEWWRHDIRAIRAVEQGYVRRTDAVTDRHLATPQEIEEHPIYTQFLVPHGLGWCAGAGVSPDPLIDVWIGVQRSKAEAPFSDDELEVLTRLARHAEHALRLSVRLFGAEMSKLALGDALARIGIGVFVLDACKRIVFSNPAAVSCLGDGLATANRRLSANQPGEQRNLEAAIEQTLSDHPNRNSPKPILVRRDAVDRPLVLYVLPVPACGLQDVAAHFLAPARVIVLVIDSLANASADPAIVRDLLGLTLGEARVAALVGSGCSPLEAAQRLGIAEGTARVVLKRVFSKVGVSRQSELAALLARMVVG